MTDFCGSIACLEAGQALRPSGAAKSSRVLRIIPQTTIGSWQLE